MKSIQTKIAIVIAVIMLSASASFMITAMVRNKKVLDDDSDSILLKSAEYYTNIIDDNFRSAEQSVGSIYNYALKRAETYTSFLNNETERDKYTNDISELGKSIAENTRGAMAVYLRYNPDDFGPTSGFWYTINIDDGSWQSSVPTDMSLYEKDDIEHVGWYYIPVSTGVPMWMDPYFNKNLGVEMISYIIPFFYGNYTVGIMGMDIDMSVLREAVSKISVYESGRAFLLAKDGNIIYHENYQDGIDFDNLTDKEKVYFKDILNLPRDTINHYKSINGQNEKLILKDLNNGMVLGLYVPNKEIESPQKRLARQMVIITFVIFIMSIIICFLWVRTIIRPLKKMTDVAENYANGDFLEDLTVNSNDEVGILSKSLQTMATSLKQQIELADAANRAKSDFLANMSHEIRTPINAVLGMNEMILRETDDDNIKNYAFDIHIAGETLLSIINDILDMSKIESGKMEIIPVEYNVNNLINDVINMISLKLKDKNIEFITDIDDSIPSVLLGDDIRIRQILYNLLTNAIKYTKEGSITLTIQNEFIDDMSRLYFSVKDTGIGIADDDLAKLFQAFVRIDENKNRNIAGTGLGLNIVSMLLNLMNSELKVESEYGKGSDFHFTLYQPVINAEPISSLENHKNDLLSEYDYCTERVIPDVNLLVVDDNAMNRKVFINLLKGLKCKIDQVESGMECLEHINDKKYDIIFMDHMMPEMDGIETFHRIRNMEDCINKDTPIIVLTANAIAGAKDKYMEEGFDDFLSKPIAPEELENMIFDYVRDYKIFPKNLYLYKSDSIVSANTVALDSMTTSNNAFDVDSSSNNAGTSANTTDNTFSATISNSDNGKWNKDNLPEVEGADFSFALQKLKSVDLLLSVIEDFSVMALNDMNTLQEMYDNIKLGNEDEESFKAYRIQVHAMKSTAAMTGAVNASALARVLEYAARDGDLKTIDAVMGVFEKEWIKIKEQYDKAFGLNSNDLSENKETIDIEVLYSKLDELGNAMETLDTDVADAIIDEFKGYAFEEKEEKIYKALAVAVRNLDIDESLKLIKEWIES